MNQSDVTKVEWTLVFCDSSCDHWFVKRLKKGFQHVYAVRKDCSGYFWMIVDPMLSHTNIRMEPVSMYPSIQDLLYTKSTIVPVCSRIDIEGINGTLGVNSCVDIVKGLLGIKAFWVLTPYQLYKHLGFDHG